MAPNHNNLIDPDLLDAARRGQLTPEQQAQLNTLFHEHPESIRLYAEHMQLEAELSWGFVVRSRSELNVRPTGDHRDRAYRLYAVMGASLAAMIVLATALWFYFDTKPSAPVEQPRPPAIAILADTQNAEFVDAAEPLAIGTNLPPGVLKLGSGTAQVLFNSGAVVDLVGPCEFQMIRADQAALTAGRLTAYVPAEARGFTVDGPGDVRIVDLGTEFYMDVQPGGRVEVRVMQGSVQVLSHNWSSVVNESEAVLVSSTEGIRTIAFEYPGTEMLNAGLTGWWPLDEMTETGQFTNRVHADLPAVAGPSVTEASMIRGVDGRAVQFDGQRNYLRIANPASTWPGHEPFSISLWMKTPGMPGEQWLIYREDHDDNPKVSVSMLDGVIWFKLRDHLGVHHQLPAESVNVADDRWHHLVVVRDGTLMQLYIDGKLAGELTNAVFSGHFDPDAPSAWHLGSNVTGVDRGIDGFFRGAIDEVRIYRRALSPNEVELLHRNAWAPGIDPEQETSR